MGFSAGGLATLLSAADNPGPWLWVGLDPVDHNGMGARAAPAVTCHAVVLTSEPSACNGHVNTRSRIAALPNASTSVSLRQCHVDAEWPTDRMAEAICGRFHPDVETPRLSPATAALDGIYYHLVDDPGPGTVAGVLVQQFESKSPMRISPRVGHATGIRL